MNAVILAGGYGNRLKPLTDTLPKPMLSICNRPMIDYCVAQLAFYGIKDIIFSLGYMPEKIVEWAAGYSEIKTRFSIEDIPLGTLGGVKAAANKLTDVFIVISGDGLSDIDLNAMLNRHLATKAAVTMAVKEVPNPSLYGVAELGDDGFIRGFIEKPHDIKQPAFVNCGTYVINKEVLNLVSGENCDFAKDLFPILVKEGGIGYYKHHGYWMDIGDFASYYYANFDMLKNSFFPQIKNIYDKDYKSTVVETDSVFMENLNFGGRNLEELTDEWGGTGSYSQYLDSYDFCLVSDKAQIHGQIFECIVGRNSMVAAGGNLSRCLVLDGAKAFGKHHGCIFGAGGVRIDILGEQQAGLLNFAKDLKHAHD